MQPKMQALGMSQRGASVACGATRVVLSSAVLGAHQQRLMLCSGQHSNILPFDLQPASSSSTTAGLKERSTQQAAASTRQGKSQARQLMQRICSCSTWQELQTVVHEHAQTMNSVHLSALVVRLAKVFRFHAADQAQHGFDTFLQSVSAMVSRNLDELDPRALANILWAVATLGFCPSYTLVQRYLFAAYLHLPNMNAQEVANLAWAAATMQLQPGQVWLAQLCKQASAKAHAMKPMELAHCTWAIGQLTAADQYTSQPPAARTAPVPDVHATGSPAAEHANPRGAQPQYNGTVCQAIRGLQSAALQRLDNFKPGELEMILLALYKLMRQHSTQQTRPSVTEPAALMNVSDTRQCQEQQQRQWQWQQDSFSHLLLSAVQRLLQEQHLASFSLLSMCHLACMLTWTRRTTGSGSLARTRVLVRSFCQHVEHYSSPHLSVTSPRVLTRLLWAMAGLRASPTQAWLTACHHRLTVLSAGAAAAQVHQPVASQHLNGKSLATAVCALAHLHKQSAKAAASIPSSDTATYGTSSGSSTNGSGHRDNPKPGLPVELQEALAAQLHEVEMPQLAQLVAALGQLLPGSGQPVQPQLARALQKELHLHLHLPDQDPHLKTATATQCLDMSCPPQLQSTSAALQDGVRAQAAGPDSCHSRRVQAPTLDQLQLVIYGMVQMRLMVSPSLLASILQASLRAAVQASASAAMAVGSSSSHADTVDTALRLLLHACRITASNSNRRDTDDMQLACRVRLSALAGWLAGHASVLHPVDAYRVLLALHAARVFGKGSMQQALHALAQQVSYGLHAFPPAHMARALVVMVHLGFQPGPRWKHACVHLIHQHQNSCGLEDLSSMMWCLARWRVQLDWDVLPHLVGRISWLVRTSSLGTPPAANDVLRMLWAITKLQLLTPRLHYRLTQLALQGLPQLSHSEALWLLQTVSQARQRLLRSQWRHLIRAISQPCLKLTHKLTAKPRRRCTREAQKCGDTVKAAGRVLLRASSAKHMAGVSNPMPEVVAKQHQQLQVKKRCKRVVSRRSVKRLLSMSLHCRHMGWLQQWPTWLKARRQLLAGSAEVLDPHRAAA